MSNTLVSSAEKNIVFKSFPNASALFAADFGSCSDVILRKYGGHEFRAGVLANELHGHLGVYTIIGVKMGIMARDYFFCGQDEMEVVSYTGNTPPVSCLNDGIQVSTGATLGHGLITVNDSSSDGISVEFYLANRGIRMSLKKEVAELVKNNFQQIMTKNGLFSEQYWDQIRQLAIQYWLELDRKDIFLIEDIRKT